MGAITFLTGPVRSGKSRRAVDLASTWGEHVVFVATYEARQDDAEMAERIRRHRTERPPSWRTLEAPDEVAQVLRQLSPGPSGVVLDCLTLWISARLHWTDEELLATWDRFLAFCAAVPWPTAIVSNEIGWSLVPDDALLRRYRDLVGWAGQRTATCSSDAWLMVAGQAIRLK